MNIHTRTTNTLSGSKLGEQQGQSEQLEAKLKQQIREQNEQLEAKLNDFCGQLEVKLKEQNKQNQKLQYSEVIQRCVECSKK